MAFWNRQQDITPIQSVVPVVQGEIVQSEDEDFDLMQAMAYQAMRDFKGDPTMTPGAISELAKCAHLSEEEVRRRLE